MAEVSAIVVSYNTRRLLLECLTSLVDATGVHALNILVVDNASVDGSAEAVAQAFPQARVVRNERNVGFAKAVNQALPLATGSYVLLLNPDALITSRALEELVTFMEAHPEVGMASPQLLNEDGTPQGSLQSDSSYSLWIALRVELGLTRFRSRARRSAAREAPAGHPQGSPMPVDCLYGTCLLVRKGAADAVGPLDERFFMYWEDNDWSRRFRLAGWTLCFLPQVRVVHYGGGSSGQTRIPMVVQSYESRYLFYRKHFGASKAALFRLIVGVGRIKRAMGAFLRTRNEDLARENRAVLRWAFGRSSRPSGR